MLSHSWMLFLESSLWNLSSSFDCQSVLHSNSVVSVLRSWTTRCFRTFSLQWRRWNGMINITTRCLYFSIKVENKQFTHFLFGAKRVNGNSFEFGKTWKRVTSPALSFLFFFCSLQFCFQCALVSEESCSRYLFTTLVLLRGRNRTVAWRRCSRSFLLERSQPMNWTLDGTLQPIQTDAIWWWPKRG